jgi:glycosyltransferase involved in cell wall biosynthesis
VKLKAVEALQSGVPTVATTVGAESIPTGVASLLQVSDDPQEFAELVAREHEDSETWYAQRQRLAEQVALWSAHPQTSIWPGLVTRLASKGRG